MVEKKRRRIAPKPSAAPPAADEWVKEGGLDPEVSSESQQPPTPKPAQSNQEEESAAKVSEETDKSEKKYPHRISFDMESAQYKRLKWASFDRDRPMNELLREAVDDWMKARGY